MKTRMHKNPSRRSPWLQIISGGAMALSLLTGCQASDGSRVDPASADGHEALAYSISPSTLVQPEPGATATEYSVRAVTLRLFGTSGAAGVSAGSVDETSAPFATLADTATWATTNYALGETIGRNLRLVAVFEDGIELVDSEAGGARLRLSAGEDLSVRLVEHRFDRAVIDEGQHQFVVNGTGLAGLLASRGLGATLTRMEAAFAGYRGLALVRVDRRGALARLGLNSGDRLLAIDGESATADGLAAWQARLQSAQPGTFLLTVGRGGSVWEATYVVK